MVRVSQISWCRFCIDINASLFAERAGSQEKLEALEGWRESELFSKREKVVLEYAEAITYPDGRVSDELITRLREFFDEDGIVELAGLVALGILRASLTTLSISPLKGLSRLSPN